MRKRPVEIIYAAAILAAALAASLALLSGVARAQYAPIPNYTGAGAGANFRSAVNDRFGGTTGVEPRLDVYSYSSLPSEADGKTVYCSNCKETSPCSTGGSGAFAFGINGTWDCSPAAAGAALTTVNNDANVTGSVGGGGSTLTLGWSGQLGVPRGGTAASTAAGARANLGTQPDINVKDYGATGDGSTNDASAIQSALNACQTAGGGTVYLPPGTYYLGNPATTVNMAGAADGTDQCILEGAGTGISIISGAGAALVQMANASVVRDLGETFTAASSANIGLDLDQTANTNNRGVSNWAIEDVRIVGSGKTGTGITGKSFLLGRMTGVSVSGFNVDFDTESWDDAGTYYKSNSNYIAGNTFQGGNVGAVYGAASVDDGTFIGNVIENNGINMVVESSHLALLIAQNHFEADTATALAANTICASPNAVVGLLVCGGTDNNLNLVSNDFSGFGTNDDIYLDSATTVADLLNLWQNSVPDGLTNAGAGIVQSKVTGGSATYSGTLTAGNLSVSGTVNGATPGVTAGTGISVSGSWPAQAVGLTHAIDIEHSTAVSGPVTYSLQNAWVTTEVFTFTASEPVTLPQASFAGQTLVGIVCPGGYTPTFTAASGLTITWANGDTTWPSWTTTAGNCGEFSLHYTSTTAAVVTGQAAGAP